MKVALHTIRRAHLVPGKEVDIPKFDLRPRQIRPFDVVKLVNRGSPDAYWGLFEGRSSTILSPSQALFCQLYGGYGHRYTANRHFGGRRIIDSDDSVHAALTVRAALEAYRDLLEDLEPYRDGRRVAAWFNFTGALRTVAIASQKRVKAAGEALIKAGIPTPAEGLRIRAINRQSVKAYRTLFEGRLADMMRESMS